MKKIDCFLNIFLISIDNFIGLYFFKIFYNFFFKFGVKFDDYIWISIILGCGVDNVYCFVC